MKQRVAQLLIAQYDSSNSMYGLTLRMIFFYAWQWVQHEHIKSFTFLIAESQTILGVSEQARIIISPHCSFPLSLQAASYEVFMFMSLDNPYNMQINYKEQILC